MPSSRCETRDREAIRILVKDIGYTEASNQLQIKRDTLYKWGQRYGWKEPVQHAQSARVQSVQSPGDAHAVVMTERKEQSASHLSEYVVNASSAATKLGDRALKEAQNVRHVAAVREHLWPQEKQQQANVMVNIALLGVDPDSVRVETPDAIDLDNTLGTGEPAP